MPVAKRGNRVFKSLHKPLTYLGMERSLFFMVCVTAVGCFNLFNSILAGIAVFVAGFLFGLWVTNTEEEEKIVPAVEACRRRGWNVERPLPADTLFYRAQRGDFDLVIAMYHDQGHGPVKVLGLEAGVNITIGLPVVRTSVDHGTAFDIAGTGKADERSLLEAMRQAVQLAPK